jgi:hypothetical protein
MEKRILMMKTALRLFLVVGLFPVALMAQKTDPIEYYTDSDINDTKFSLAASYAPSFSGRRLALYTPVQDGTELFALTNEDGGGVLGQRYGFSLFYELRSMFHIGIGWSQEHSGYLTRGFAVFDQNAIFQDTIGTYTAKTSYNAINIPIQIVFHTQMTDVWALQVIPSYDLTFYSGIQREWIGDEVPNFPADAATGVLGSLYERGTEVKYMTGFNGSIGFAIGNEFTIANNLALTVRGEFRYGLLPINKEDIGLREVPYGVGAAVGFRYYL